MSAVRAFILAGGQGRRLAPLTTVIPKPLVPVGERAILELLLLQLARQNITEITISLGYLGHLIRAVIGGGERLGVNVTYTEESEPLGTAGALGLLPDPIDHQHVLVVNGDTFTDLDFIALLDDHRTSGASITVAARHREVQIDYGVLETDHEGRLCGYDEKPTLTYLVSMGINLVRADVLTRLRPARRIDFPSFLKEVQDGGGTVRCFVSDCTWLDLGRIDDVRLANARVAQDPDLYLPPL